jgi:hypothetical protein
LNAKHSTATLAQAHDAGLISGAAMKTRAGVEFKSYVAAVHRGELEQLVFFNACQTRVWDDIVDAVERFGPPEIVGEKDRLRLVLRDQPDAQSLFAVEQPSGRPVGVAIYVRPDHEHITVLHVGVAEGFASGGQRADEFLLLRMLRELRRSSRKVKGVQRLELYYLTGRQAMRTRRSPAFKIKN